MDTQSESLPASERLPSDNEKKVFESCLKAAEQGDAAAQFNLGFYYANGRGVAKDEVEAAKWYRKGAEQGYALAQNNLALCYHNGTGVIQNSIEALNWFEKAAAQGFSRAQCFLAVTTFQSEDFAMVDAALRGGNGTATLKSQTAFAYANKAAEQNLSAAEYLLGEFYRLGYGVKQSSEIALNWYSKAAVNGYQAAKYRVSAQWLIDSTPGSQDASEDNKEYNSRLYSLQNIASQQVDHIWVAKRVLGEIHSSRARAFEDEKSSSIERNRAMFWYESAVTHGDKEAAFKLRQLKREHAAYAPTSLQMIYDKAALGFGVIAGIAIGIVVIFFLILVLMGIFDGSGTTHYEDPWNEEPMLSPR